MINFALLGCGRIAQRYGQLLAGGHIAGARLVGAAEVNTGRARAFSSAFGCPVYADMHEMLKVVRPDVVCVLTPSGMHADHVCVLASLVGSIVVEKPMALRLEDAHLMQQQVDACGCRLFVVKQNRYNLPVTKLREAIDQGRFGRLLMGTVRVRWCRPQAYYDQDPWRGTWKYDGGVLANQASHHLDLLEWFLGAPERIWARGYQLLANIQAEDTATALLDFKNGAAGVIEATTATRPRDAEGSLSVLGERGMVEIGGFAVNRMLRWQFDQMGEEDNLVQQQFSENPPDVYGFGHRRYLEAVVRALQQDGVPEVGVEDGVRSVRFLTALYTAMAQPGGLSFDSLAPQRDQCPLGADQVALFGQSE